uniref:WD repeat-containing protein 55 homolog n=3 Tax=Clastoptera arizonana TaxID=38151 RepID=A0A1B6DJ89_9HEMI
MKQPRKYKSSVFRNIYEQPYNELIRIKLYNSTKGNLDLIQRLSLQRKLAVHNGCVNCICWNDTGDLLLSGSDDQHLVISHAYNYKMLTDYKTSHRANIFSAKFLPCCGDSNIVSCSGDGIILYTDLLRPLETHNNQFNCHIGTTYEIATVPNEPYTFLSCGEDSTVRFFDLRTKEKCNKADCKDDVLITCQRAVTALTVNAVMPYQIAIGCSDSTVRLYDRRMLGTKYSGYTEPNNGPKPLIAFTAPGMEDRSYRITSLGFSPEGEDVLVSYSSEHLYLFNIKDHMNVEFEPSIEESLEPYNQSGTDKVSRNYTPVRRLRLRGDWSDTGPDARPEREAGLSGDAGQARPTLHATLMQRMTDVLTQMLNDPATRAALSHGGEEESYSEELNRRHRNASSGGLFSVAIQTEQRLGNRVPSTPPATPWPSTSQPTPSDTEPSTSANSNSNDTVSLPSFESTYSSFSVAKSSPQLDNTPSTSTASTSEPVQDNSQKTLKTFSNQFNTMRHGFIEKHGTEPVVNLTYSDQSSTTPRISMSLGDEVSREPAISPRSSSEGRNSQAGSSTQDSSANTSNASASSMPEAMSEGEEFFDEEMEIIDSTTSSETNSGDSPKSQKSSSHSPENDYYKVRKPPVKMKFTGHRNARTMIKEATFWGRDYVLSGSDCGHVFIWDRYTAQLVMLLEADHHVVNCIQPHPFLPLLATSGIDYDVKLWAPNKAEPSFDYEKADELMKRNAVMLEETKDTITVPASFMIRMLACLNQIRRGRNTGLRQRGRRRDGNREGGSE